MGTSSKYGAINKLFSGLVFNIGAVMNVEQTITTSESTSQSKPLHVCPAPHPNFTGRKSKLKEIQMAIESCQGRTTWQERVIVIHGVGGMGKTEMSKVIAQECRKKFDYIKWFDVETKNSTMAGFKSFAKALQVNFESKYDCPEICRQLDEKYNSGIFIFDNVEGMETFDNVFGIYDFLPGEYECEHPIIIMTSRHGRFSVKGNTCNFKMINIESLSVKESYECLVNYLGIQDQKIPKPLQELINELAANIQGYPLALSLIGKLIAGKAEAASFAGIEAKIQDYIQLFEEHSFKDLFGKSKLKVQIKIICRWTLDKMLTEEDGEIAFEILGILAMMINTDELVTGLVHGIYFNQWFDEFKSNFQLEDANLRFRSGLKLLVTYSLVTLKDFRSNDNEYVTMHRLIQSSVLEYLRFCPDCACVIEKICKYYTFDDIELTYPDFDDLFELRRSLKSQNLNHLLILNWFNLVRSADYFRGNLSPSRRNIIEAQHNYLKSQTLDSDQVVLLKLSEYFYQVLTDDDYNANITVSDVETGILSLTRCYRKNFWVVRCCVEILSCIDNKDNGIIKRRSELCKWLKRSWKECEALDRPNITIIKCVWNLGGWNQVDTDFIMSVLTMSRADTQLGYWSNLEEMFRSQNYHSRIFEVVNARVFSYALQQEILMSEFSLYSSSYTSNPLLMHGIKSSNFCKQLCQANFSENLASALSNGLQFWIQNGEISTICGDAIFKVLIVILTLKKFNLCSWSEERLLNSINYWLKWLQSYLYSFEILTRLVYEAFADAEEFLKLCVTHRVSRWINVVHEFFNVIDDHLTKFIRSAIEKFSADKFTSKFVGGKTVVENMSLKEIDHHTSNEFLYSASRKSSEFRKRWSNNDEYITMNLKFTAVVFSDKQMVNETAAYLLLFWLNLFDGCPELSYKIENQLKPLFNDVLTKPSTDELWIELCERAEWVKADIEFLLQTKSAAKYVTEIAQKLFEDV